MAKAYFILAERDAPGAAWCCQFGDYDRQTVASEASDYREHGIKAANLKIIRCANARASTVDAALAAFNA